MNQLWRDVRQGARAMWKDPGFAAVAILTLGLGIGANTTVFSWMNSTLLNPIPGAKDTGRLVAMFRGRSNPFSYPDFADLRDRNRSFSAFSTSAIMNISITGQDRPERLWGVAASANYFELLGVRPVLGRGFAPEEDQPGAAPAVIISYRLWQDRFGGRAEVLGQTIPLNSQRFTIVGVTPPEFQGNYTGLRAELWVPVRTIPLLRPDDPQILEKRDVNFLGALGRLRPGLDRSQAQAEMSAVWEQIGLQHPETHKGRAEVTLYPLWRSPNGANGLFSKLLPPLFGLAGVVLLLACSNLANLVLARGVVRRREMAIRLSLGASRARLVRQLMAENFALALVGGLVAFGVTIWTASKFMSFAPVTSLPIWLPTQVDYGVFGAALGFSLLATILFGSLPALRASRLDPVSAIKEEGGAGGPRSSRLSSVLASAQVMLCFVLLVSAVLLIRSFRAIHQFDPGFNPHRVLLETYDLMPAGYSEARGIEFHRRVLEESAALPGVDGACLSDWVPMSFVSNTKEFDPEGYNARKDEAVEAGVAHVSPGYFATMQIPLVSGRDFSAQDSAESQAVVIVNQTLAERYWPGQEAAGKGMRIAGNWAMVAAVAKNSHYNELEEDPQPFIYLPIYQFYSPEATLHLRSNQKPVNLAAAATELIHHNDASLPVFDIATLEARTEGSAFGQRLAATFLGSFAVLALVLAAVGIYGVVAYRTEQRTRELGIRMALGARPADVLRLVLRQGLRLTLAGSVVGLIAALGAARLIARMLFGVTPTDPASFAGVTILLTSVALAACYLPARRAVRVDPLVALRHE